MFALPRRFLSFRFFAPSDEELTDVDFGTDDDGNGDVPPIEAATASEPVKREYFPEGDVRYERAIQAGEKLTPWRRSTTDNRQWYCRTSNPTTIRGV